MLYLLGLPSANKFNVMAIAWISHLTDLTLLPMEKI